MGRPPNPPKSIYVLMREDGSLVRVVAETSRDAAQRQAIGDEIVHEYARSVLLAQYEAALREISGDGVCPLGNNDGGACSVCIARNALSVAEKEKG